MKVYKYKINGNDYEVAVSSVTGNSAEVTVNGTAYHVEKSTSQDASAASAQPSKPAAARPDASAAVVPSGAGKAVQAPLPGVIVAIPVAVGDVVKAGQVVAVLEAMKMENEIQAECDGTVVSVNVVVGDSVLEGAAIVTIG